MYIFIYIYIYKLKFILTKLLQKIVNTCDFTEIVRFYT